MSNEYRMGGAGIHRRPAVLMACKADRMSSAGQPEGRLRAGAGLCDACVHQRVVHNTRGSVFSLCLRSREDPTYPRYPGIPVRACPGFEPRAGERAG